MRTTEAEPFSSPISPNILAGSSARVERVTGETAHQILADLIAWLCRGEWKPASVCIGTYGATMSERGEINGISRDEGSPLNGQDIRKIVSRLFSENGASPTLSVETDVGVYAIGENYMRALPRSDGTAELTTKDPIAFGFFSGGVGAAVCQNLRLIRGLQVGHRGKMPVYPHPLDLSHGFRPVHRFPFSIEAMTCVSSIKSRATLIDGFDGSLADLIQRPEAKTWDIVAYYIAMFCFSLVVNYSPRLIVLGGRTVTHPTFMLERVRQSYSELTRNTLAIDRGTSLEAGDPHSFIQLPHSIETCLYGSLEVARRQFEKDR
ncbi:ROK family protein [Salipiger pacificus]|nr:ROK family protein [Alloyangia pacifica]